MITNIENFLETSGLTVPQVAQQLGYKSPDPVYRWLRGDQRISARNVERLAKLFHTTPALLDPAQEAYRPGRRDRRREAPPDLAAQLRFINSEFRQLSAAKRQKLLEAIVQMRSRTRRRRG